MTKEQMARGSRLQPLAKAVLRTQSDERLVRLVREGRDAAFEEIVRRYRQPLVAFAAAYAPTDPEDVVQESLARSWESLRESTGEMNLKPWLYTIVRNRALNARRDTRFHEELTDELDGVPQPPDVALTNEELARVVAAVGALPDQQREALVRSALEGHTHEQIAAAIGATPGAVRQLIFRGRAAVRNGVGLMIPLPLVRALAESGPAAETGAAAAGAGAVIAGGGAGASLATKAAIVAAVGAIAAGTGVAIESSRGGDAEGEQAPQEQITKASEPKPDPPPASAPAAVPTDAGESNPGRRSEADDDGGGSDDSGDENESDDDSSSSGPSPSSGSSGSGSSGSGSSGSSGSGSSGSSGSGSGDDEPEVEVEVEDLDDSSGSDSSDSDSSGSDDSSGSGSGSDDEFELDDD